MVHRFKSRLLASVAAILLGGLLMLLTVAQAAAARPNLLLIIADDYATDGSSLYNTNAAASLPPTPNIVRLAQSGVLFRNAYAYPTCSPTRSTILTGRYGFRTGIGYALESPSEPVLTSYEHTLPEMLDAAATGYRHAMIGKWHLSFDAADPNTLGGFSHFSGGLHGALQNYYNWLKTIDGTNYNGYNVYATRDNAEDAIAWLRQRESSTNAWFLWLAFNASHTRYHKPPTNMCPHFMSLPAGQANVDANPRPYYEAITEAMDTAIGWVMTNVNLQTTTVLFLGDNGTLGSVDDGNGNLIPIIQPPYPASHGKGTLYEGGIRVPLIIAGAGVANPDRECLHLVHTVDLYATILELAGVKVAQILPAELPFDSRSLLPILQNPDAPAPRDWVLSENFSDHTESARAGRSLRNLQFKLIETQDGRREFYDLLVDPYETNDLLLAPLTLTQSNQLASLHGQLAGLQNVPRIAQINRAAGRSVVTADLINGTEFSLWRNSSVTGPWTRAENAAITTTTNTVRLTEPLSEFPAQFYRVSAPER